MSAKRVPLSSGAQPPGNGIELIGTRASASASAALAPIGRSPSVVDPIGDSATSSMRSRWPATPAPDVVAEAVFGRTALEGSSSMATPAPAAVGAADAGNMRSAIP